MSKCGNARLRTVPHGLVPAPLPCCPIDASYGHPAVAGLGNFSFWSAETLQNVSGGARPADAAARAFRTAAALRPEFAPEEPGIDLNQTTGGGLETTTSGIWWAPAAPRRLDTSAPYSAKGTSSSGPNGPENRVQDYAWKNYAWQNIVKRVAQRGDWSNGNGNGDVEPPPVDAEQAKDAEGREPPPLRGQNNLRRAPSPPRKASRETGVRNASSSSSSSSATGDGR